MPGRVGDTPIVGAGGYADNQVRLHSNIFSLQDIFSERQKLYSRE